MAKNKKENKKDIIVPANIEALLKAHAPKSKRLVYGEGDTELSFNVSKATDIMKRVEIINDSADLMFASRDNGITGYIHSLYDIALRFGLISCYTDLILPADINLMNAMVMHTPIVNDIIGVISFDEYDRFVRDFDAVINIKKQALLISEGIIKSVEIASGAIKNIGKRLKKADIKKMLDNIQGALPSGFNIDEVIKTISDFTNIKNN